MPATSSSYPGKIILFGEHAVVYHSHAIAIPVNQVRTTAVITPLIQYPPGSIEVSAPDINTKCRLNMLAETDPIGYAVRLTLQKLHVDKPPAFSIHITSNIPIAAGLGSGASVSCSIAKSISTYLGKPFSPVEISDIAFEVEKLHHGIPSGVDNTVIAIGQPVLFQHGEEIQSLQVGETLNFIIADTGIKAQTGEVVGSVRLRWQADPTRFDTLFQQIDHIVLAARDAIRIGDVETTGKLMLKNHQLLQDMEVSHPALDRLVETAMSANALGAKLSGAGWGGNMIALVRENALPPLENALLQAGAVRVIRTRLESSFEESHV
ncbi:MAG: mevalonate kinase [Anaerolinea sp.]|nr:mevalonate kinase [Anaerolinea sp.]